jgi:hypothetical protein
MKQITDTILMIRPLHFCMNEETAVYNYFQNHSSNIAPAELLALVQKEFDLFAETLIAAKINTVVVEDRADVITPDSIFPNNWISFHSNGDVALYPMFAENRRMERRDDLLDGLADNGFQIRRVIDLSDAEQEEKFLEGTGSMVLDRENGLAYCALSERSDLDLLDEFCEIFGYKAIPFSAFQSVEGKRMPIYHTNVLLTIGESFAVFCADSVDDDLERTAVLKSLKRTEKEVILISEDQLVHFAGNMLQVHNRDGERFLVMSQTAWNSLSEEQIQLIQKHSKILTVDIPTIEKLGGGSARCMMAEVFLPSEE